MRIFVTGGTGFVGSHLVDALLSRGEDVACLVRDPGKLERVFPNARPEPIVGDLLDADALARGAADAKVVFHVAGLTAARSRSEFLAINSNATRNLAKIVQRAAPRLEHFVYVSSAAASGPSQPDRPRTEGEPTQPVSDYGWSKLAGEEGVRQSGLPWTIVRPPTVYGPRDTEVLKIFKLARLGIAPVFGDGSQPNSFIFGPDLAEALIACISPPAVEHIYFACHPEVRTQRELAVMVHGAVAPSPPTRGPVFVPVPGVAARAVLGVIGTTARVLRRATLLNADRANDFLAPAWTCSPEAIARDTGWRARTDLASGLVQTANWYRTQRWL